MTPGVDYLVDCDPGDENLDKPTAGWVSALGWSSKTVTFNAVTFVVEPERGDISVGIELDEPGYGVGV